MFFNLYLLSFCAACYTSHLQVTWLTGHFVSFGEKYQHDLHGAGEEWGLAPEKLRSVPRVYQR